VTRYGSLINQVTDGMTNGVKPEVGMGGTMLHWSDRTPVTVVEVSRTGHKLVVQEDTATRTDSNGMSEAQSYEYERNPNGALTEFTRRKDGSYRVKGGNERLMLGHRDKYHDYSF
jgi:hypothetical protein